MLNFLSYNLIKKYTQKKIKALDHIISCIIYKSPNIISKNIDFKVLEEFNINVSYPILYFTKVDLKLVETLIVVKKFFKFNIVIKGDKLDKNIIKQLDCIIINNPSLNLFANLNKMNVYVDNKFKINKTKNQFIIKSNKNKLCIKLNDNNYKNKINNVNINIRKFYLLNNIFYIFNLNNLNLEKTNIKLFLLYNLPIKYYTYKRCFYALKIKDIITNKSYFISSSNKVKFNYKSKSEILPYISFCKPICLDAKENKSFVISISNKFIDYKKLNNFTNFIEQKFEKLFNIKIDCLDKNIKFLFNEYLPLQIRYYGIKQTKININKINNINKIKQLYKNKIITNFDYYIWLKTKYFGIKEDANFIKINPLTKNSFIVYYKQNNKTTKIFVNNKNLDKKQMIFDGVKYGNYLNINKIKLQSIKSVLLEI